MAVDPQHTLGFLSGGYRNVAQFKRITLTPPPGQTPKYSSLLVGWDAADWEVMLPLLERGAMPATAALMNGAARANLATLDPPISPMLWTSIATSSWPSAHGIHGFTEIHEGAIRAVRGSSIQVPTVWDHLEASGIPATTVAWWPSHPATASRLGALRISNLAASEDARWLHDGVHPSSHAHVLEQLMLSPEELPTAAVAAFFPGIEITGEDAVARSVLKIITHALNVQTMATYALEHGPGGHASVYFDALDHFKHLGMKYAPPKLDGIDEASFTKYQFIIEAAYRLHDLCLGALLRYTTDESHVLLISDHGFKSGHQRPLALPRHAGAPALEHRHFGVFIARGPELKTSTPISGLNLLDIAPILLNIHKISAPVNMQGSVPSALLPDPVLQPVEMIPRIQSTEAPLQPEGPLLQTLIDLGYLEPEHVNPQEGRLLENRYYLARSLRAEGRPELAWQVLREFDLQPDAPLRYQQLAASLLAESGQMQALAVLLEDLGQPTEGLLWRYYRELVHVHEGGELRIPEYVFDSATAEERVLWGKLMVKAKEYDSLERLLSKDSEGRIDLLNLRIRLALAREDWEEVLHTALESTAVVYHQPWVHGALVVAFKQLGMNEEARTAQQVQQRMLPHSDSRPLYIVTGPPRSGTSLAMRLLEAVGIVPVTDGVRTKDTFNARGYFEHEKIKQWDFDRTWLENQRGKAVKIVEPLLVRAPWPTGRKVVVRMNRPMPAVLQSQRHLKGSEHAPLGWSELSDWEEEYKRTSTFLQMDPHAVLIDLYFEDLIAAATSGTMHERLTEALRQLSQFTALPVDISSVKAVVEPELRRF